MKKYTKKIMAMVTVAATMVTGTAIPVMADDAPTIRLITWLTPSNPAQKPSYDAIESFADDHADEFTLEHENIVGDELKAKIKTDIAGDTVPDILFIGEAAETLLCCWMQMLLFHLMNIWMRQNWLAEIYSRRNHLAEHHQMGR